MTSLPALDEVVDEQHKRGLSCLSKRINEEFRRRTKTQASLPSEEAVLFLLFGLLGSGQITLRRLVGWQALANNNSQAEAA